MNSQSHNAFSSALEGASLVAQPLTMSSREIAELTGKRHDHVMRDIRVMLELLDKNTAPNFGGSYQDSTGRTLPCFNLPKRECIILVSGYDVTMRARIVDRWMELEAKVAPTAATIDYADPAVMLGVMQHLTATIAQKDAVIAQQIETIEAAQPKVEFYDAYGETGELYGFQNAGRVLRQGPNKFPAWLRQQRYTFTQGGRDVPHRRYGPLGAGFFEVKLVQDPNGNQWQQTFVTTKGIRHFAQCLGVKPLEGGQQMDFDLQQDRPSRRTALGLIGGALASAAASLLSAPPPKAEAAALATICIDGQSVTFDAARFRVGPDDLVACAFNDGHFGVVKVRQDDVPVHLGRRAAWIKDGAEWVGGWVLGTVVA